MVFLDFIKTKQSDISKKAYSIIVKSLKKHNNKICNKLSDKCLQLENEKLKIQITDKRKDGRAIIIFLKLEESQN